MCVGEKRELTIPPHLAYGSQGVAGVIPPNEQLTFEVQLVSVDRASIFKGLPGFLRSLLPVVVVAYIGYYFYQRISEETSTKTPKKGKKQEKQKQTRKK